MVPQELIEGVVAEDIAEVRDRDQSVTVLREVVVNALQHPVGIRLMLQEIEREEHVVRTAFQDGSAVLREAFPDVQALFPRLFHQGRAVFDPGGFHREFREDLEEFALAAADLDKLFVFKVYWARRNSVMVVL